MRWTPEYEEILIENYLKLGLEIPFLLNLNFTKKAIQSRAFKLGITLSHQERNKIIGLRRTEKYKSNLHRYFNHLLVSASKEAKKIEKIRNIETKEQRQKISNFCVELLKKQNNKCFYSGVDLISPDISLTYSGWRKSSNISIDRTDSNIGYISSNIQLVHKDINYMKQNYSHEYFIELCKKVTENASVIQTNIEMSEQ